MTAAVMNMPPGFYEAGSKWHSQPDFTVNSLNENDSINYVVNIILNAKNKHLKMHIKRN